MAVIPLGGKIVLMEGFARQKKVATHPRKKARTIHYRRYAVPSLTAPRIAQQKDFIPAMISMRGRSFEEVIAKALEFKGKDYGGKAAKEERKRLRYAEADAYLRLIQSL